MSRDNIASALYNFHRTVDCSWLDWSDWSACNQTCGGGQRYRIRVSSPALYGGKNCSGASEEKETCNSQPCPGKSNICVSVKSGVRQLTCCAVDGYWGQWTQWSACSFTCGSGIQTRTRVCVPPLYRGLECVGDSQQTRTCEVVPCPSKTCMQACAQNTLHVLRLIVGMYS